MKTLLSILLLAIACATGFSQSKIVTATITVTNTAGVTNGQTINVSGNVRTWTNSVAIANVQIQTTNSIGWVATNLYFSYITFPLLTATVTQPTSSNVVFKAYPATTPSFTVTLSAGWGTVSYATNTTGAGTYPLDLPTDVAYSLLLQTNLDSAIVKAINSSANTNSLLDTGVLASNLMGLHTTQTVAGAKLLTNLANVVKGSVFASSLNLSNVAKPTLLMVNNVNQVTNVTSMSGATLSAQGVLTITAVGGGVTNLAGWNTNGNGNLPAGSFLGTTDRFDLVFKANNKTYGVINTNGQIQLGTNNALTLPVLGVNLAGLHLVSLILNPDAGTGNNTMGTANAGSVILGGFQHLIENGCDGSAILAGSQNAIKTQAPGSAILGGEQNQINYASDIGSIVGGHMAYADNPGAFVWSGFADGVTTYHDHGPDTFNVRATNGAYFSDSLVVGGNEPFAPTNQFQVSGTGKTNSFLVGTNGYTYIKAGASASALTMLRADGQVTNVIMGSGVSLTGNTLSASGGGGLTTYTCSTNAGTPTIAAGVTHFGSISASGVSVGDVVSLGIEANQSNFRLIFTGHVYTANEVSIDCYNPGVDDAFSSALIIKALITHF